VGATAPTDSNDADRIAAAQAGDREAVEALVRASMPRVRNLVRYLVRGDGEVDDIAQQVLIAIVRGLRSYRGDGPFDRWADRITVRETLRVQRQARARRARHEAAQPDLRLVAGASPSADRLARRRELVRLLDQLSEAQRTSVVLHHVAGMSAPEIARSTSVPLETVRSRLRLGMKKLRALHAAEGGPDA